LLEARRDVETRNCTTGFFLHLLNGSELRNLICSLFVEGSISGDYRLEGGRASIS